MEVLNETHIVRIIFRPTMKYIPIKVVYTFYSYISDKEAQE